MSNQKIIVYFLLFLGLFFSGTSRSQVRKTKERKAKSHWYNLNQLGCMPLVGFRTMGGSIHDVNGTYTVQRLLGQQGIICAAGPLVVGGVIQIGESSFNYATIETQATLKLQPEISGKFWLEINLFNLRMPQGLQLRLAARGGWEGLFGTMDLSLEDLVYKEIDFYSFASGKDSANGPRLGNQMNFSLGEVGGVMEAAISPWTRAQMLLSLRAMYVRFYTIDIETKVFEARTLTLLQLFQVSPETFSMRRQYNGLEFSPAITLMLLKKFWVRAEGSFFPFRINDGDQLSYIYNAALAIGWGIAPGLVVKK